jgi:hypothetical protein
MGEAQMHTHFKATFPISLEIAALRLFLLSMQRKIQEYPIFILFPFKKLRHLSSKPLFWHRVPPANKKYIGMKMVNKNTTTWQKKQGIHPVN